MRAPAVLALLGELDARTATEARKRLLALPLRPGDRLVLDLRETTFIDSTGIRLILQALEQALFHGADLTVARGPAAVMRVLELIGLDEQLDLVDAP